MLFLNDLKHAQVVLILLLLQHQSHLLVLQLLAYVEIIQCIS